MYIRNLPPVLYSVEYIWEEHIQFDFGKNGTFKVINRDPVNASISYGHYKKVDSPIILQDDVQFGMFNLNDTLFIQDQGITFTLDRPWEGVSQATMPFR